MNLGLSLGIPFGKKAAGGGPVLPWDDTAFVSTWKGTVGQLAGYATSLSVGSNYDVTYYNSAYEVVKATQNITSSFAPDQFKFYTIADAAETYYCVITGSVIQFAERFDIAPQCRGIVQLGSNIVATWSRFVSNTNCKFINIGQCTLTSVGDVGFSSFLDRLTNDVLESIDWGNLDTELPASGATSLAGFISYSRVLGSTFDMRGIPLQNITTFSGFASFSGPWTQFIMGDVGSNRGLSTGVITAVSFFIFSNVTAISPAAGDNILNYVYDRVVNVVPREVAASSVFNINNCQISLANEVKVTELAGTYGVSFIHGGTV